MDMKKLFFQRIEFLTRTYVLGTFILPQIKWIKLFFGKSLQIISFEISIFIGFRFLLNPSVG